MGITCTPMGIYSQRFYAAVSLLSSSGKYYLPDANAYCAEFADYRLTLKSEAEPECERF